MHIKSDTVLASMAFRRNRTLFISTFIIAFQLSNCPLCDPGLCERGTFFDKELGTCSPCPEGTFLNEVKHTCNDCRSCTKPKAENNEVSGKPCTRVSDTEIFCRGGYYRTRDDHHNGGDCHTCTKCGIDEIESSPCSKYEDTVCRPIQDVGNKENTQTNIFSYGQVTTLPTTPVPKDIRTTLDKKNEKMEEEKFKPKPKPEIYVNRDTSEVILIIVIVLCPFIIIFICYPCKSHKCKNFCSNFIRPNRFPKI